MVLVSDGLEAEVPLNQKNKELNSTSRVSHIKISHIDVYFWLVWPRPMVLDPESTFTPSRLELTLTSFVPRWYGTYEVTRSRENLSQ